VDFDRLTLDEIKDLRAGKEVKMSDFVGGEKYERMLILGPDDIVVAEGSYTLNELTLGAIPETERYGVFVNTAPSMKLSGNWSLTSVDLRLLRHILTMHYTEGRDALDIIRSWPAERKRQIESVYPTWPKADATFNGYLPYELPLIKYHAEGLVARAKAMAEKDGDNDSLRIIQRLQRTMAGVVKTEATDQIPPDSIAQQYVGGDTLYSRVSKSRRWPRAPRVGSKPEAANISSDGAAKGAARLEERRGYELADMLKLRAAEAQKGGRQVVIAIETGGWIPQAQRRQIQPLLSQILRLGKDLRKLGLDNVRIVSGAGDGLALNIEAEIGRSGARPADVVVLAGAGTLRSRAFDKLRTTESKEGAFLAEVDPSNIEELSYVRLVEMLTIAVKLAFGGTVAAASHPDIVIQELGSRIIRLIPRAEPLRPEELREIYEAQAQSLAAA
jgi:uridine kinase